jgi:hypothetical protein
LVTSTVWAAWLDAMDAARLRAHRLLIVPGGNFLERGAPITTYPAGTPVREVTT